MKPMTPLQAENMQLLRVAMASRLREREIHSWIAREVAALLVSEAEEVLPVREPLYVEVAPDERAKPGAQTVSGLAYWREEEKAS